MKWWVPAGMPTSSACSCWTDVHHPYLDDELRKVARDAYVSWHGSRYSVPWIYAGKHVWVRERGREVGVHYAPERIEVHSQAPHRHARVAQAEHHRSIPLGSRTERKILIHLQDTAPTVEIRPLAAYESAAAGGARWLRSSECKHL